MTFEFIEAIRKGERERIAELLAADSTLAQTKTEEGLSAVLLAAYHQEPEIAHMLAERRDDLTVFEAAAVGDVNALAWILQAQPEAINTVAEDGFSPLGLAAFFGHLEAARLLIERGANVNKASENNMKVMPLHSAVAGQHLEMARLLLEHGGQVNAAQQDGFTPLHGAAQNGQMEMVELLLAHDADAKISTADGKTAADIAKEYKHDEIAALLESKA
ncbi:MAG: ankyrin repeat domain-containing protein [Anaerolineae bacterium]|nr:ankyrin repeat domain-containing protein [Anaerolineae bacterium]